jgi:hypothetical protein
MQEFVFMFESDGDVTLLLLMFRVPLLLFMFHISI